MTFLFDWVKIILSYLGWYQQRVKKSLNLMSIHKQQNRSLMREHLTSVVGEEASFLSG